MPKPHPQVELIDGGVDAGLHLLALVTPRGVEWTQEEIAYVCGCSKGYIYLLEKTAMQKLRRVCEARKLRERVDALLS